MHAVVTAPPSQTRQRPRRFALPAQRERAKTCDVRFRSDARSDALELPVGLWTEIEVTSGNVICIHTKRPLELLEALVASAETCGAELPNLEVRLPK
jgi:hypothetical protein